VIIIDVAARAELTHNVQAEQAGPDPRQIEARAQIASHLLQAHGGGVEVIPSGNAGVVRVRFTGLCTVCCLRPLTAANIVKPLLGDLDGVNDVEVEGCRLSSEAMESLAR
jgi:Fe-S cluster biogenesis protein NfuA